jgi:transcriptional regulator with XRE-family HTH domain
MGMASDLKALGKLIARERARQGLSLETLGNAAGGNRSTIMRLERGTFAHPNPDKLQRIAHALGLDAGDLFALAGYMPPNVLPSLDRYLRIVFDDLSAKDRKDVERYVEQKRVKTSKGGSRGSAR